MDGHLQRGNARIAYGSSPTTGGDRTLLVAHSLATSRRWEDEAGIFDWTPVGDSGARVVRLDSRGHGASSGEPDPARYRWSALAEDLLAVADVVSPDRPIDGLGESTGAGVVLHAALAAPDRFRRLVLVIPPTRGEAREEQAALYLAAADMIELRGPDSWQRLLTAAAAPPILRRGGWSRPTWIPIATELIPSVLRGAAASDLPDDEALASLTQPTAVLTWDTDPSHPVSSAQHLAALLPNSVLAVATSPEEVRGWGERVAAFLADG